MVYNLEIKKRVVFEPGVSGAERRLPPGLNRWLPKPVKLVSMRERDWALARNDRTDKILIPVRAWAWALKPHQPHSLWGAFGVE